jgi:two-component system chemotaxis response regulator CheB
MDPVLAPLSAIGVGASAGGLDALTRLVRGLPADLAAPVLIVLHLTPSGRSLLPEILARETPLAVLLAEEGALLRPGTVHVAPPDAHLLARDGRVRLEHGPRENSARPSVDPMLRSLAAEFGPRAIAVILSGALGDGAAGARAVADAGGTVLVQDPADASVRSMPDKALAAVGAVARRRSADELGPELGRLARGAPILDTPSVPSPEANV